MSLIEQYEKTLLSESDSLTYLPHIYFTVYKKIANNNKTLIEGTLKWLLFLQF